MERRPKKEKPLWDPQLGQPVLHRFFAEEEKVLLAFLFGSYARGRAGTHSDVDLGVLVGHDTDLDDPYRLQSELQRGVGKTLHRYDVDLILLNEAPLTLRYQVVRYGQVLFEREEGLRRWYWRRVVNEWFDTQPMRDRFFRILLKRMEEVGLGERYFDHQEDFAKARRISQEFAQQRETQPRRV